MSESNDCLTFTCGGMRISALCDSSFELDKDSLAGVSQNALDACLPGASAPASNNVYLVRLNGTTLLVDAGGGAMLDGRVHSILSDNDVNPGHVDIILLTHLHLDHVGGLLRDDKPLYPNAHIWLAEEENAFWHDDAATAELAARLAPAFGDDFIPTHAAAARRCLAAYDGRVRCFSGAAAIIPGVSAVPLFGHTPGHCGYLLGEGQEKVFIFGDIVHIAAAQFALPEAGMAFDWDMAMAVASRRKALDSAAANGWLAAGMHVPFPGTGRIQHGIGATGYQWLSAMADFARTCN